MICAAAGTGSLSRSFSIPIATGIENLKQIPGYRRRDRVVVITGASSGLGRATAVAFAATGARVVLAARRAEALEDAAAECRAGGGGALAVPADVADPAAVEALAQAAEAAFGRVDVWINAAGVLHFGRVEDTPRDVLERVLAVNLAGTIDGARTALRRFRAQGSGVLINVGSVLGVVGQPYSAAYVASKFAVRGLSESLRQELHDQPRIHVCTVLPAAIDTPAYQHAANHMGRELTPIRLLYPPQAVARACLSLARRPRREAFGGPAFGWMTALGKAAFPGLSEQMVGMATRTMEVGRRAQPPTDGAVHAPMIDGLGASGGWRRRFFGSERAPTALLIAVAAGGAALVLGPRLLRSAR